LKKAKIILIVWYELKPSYFLIEKGRQKMIVVLFPDWS